MSWSVSTSIHDVVVRIDFHPPSSVGKYVNGDPGIMYFHYNHDSQMSILPVRFAWSKVISRGGCFDGLSDLDEIFPSVKTDLNSDRRISPSSVGKYVHLGASGASSTLPPKGARAKRAPRKVVLSKKRRERACGGQKARENRELPHLFFEHHIFQGGAPSTPLPPLFFS